MLLQVPQNSAGTLTQIRSRNLLWRHLRALNELYEKGRTGAQVLENKYVEHLKSVDRLITFKPSNASVVVPVGKKYSAYYERYHRESYAYYSRFLAECDLPDDGKRQYTEMDLLALMYVQRDKETLRAGLTTMRTFSAKVFGESKYLESHQSVLAAVYQLLGIERFPAEDPSNFQWRSAVDCLDAKAVVFCENLNYLKMPWQAREHQIELWYVGGNNVGIIDHIGPEKLTLPLYYSGDWDYDGLRIFLRVREKLLDKGKAIKLLMPHDTHRAAPVDTPTHKSRWLGGLPFSKFSNADFTTEEQSLIERLIRDDLWIEEETQDLISTLQTNGAL